MKILIISQFYYPEPVRIHEICEELVKRGHEVEVVSELPSYPEGIVYDEYKHKQKRYEEINGVKVHRVFTIPRKTGPVFRILNYFSYAYSSSRFSRKKLGDKYDVIFVNQLSPITVGKAAVDFRKKFGTPVLLYCMDLWPESLVIGGVSRKSVFYKLFFKISGTVYTSADRILNTSSHFTEYLTRNFGIEEQKMDYLPQAGEGVYEQIPYNADKEVFDLFFAGNIGVLQSVKTILEAADILRDEKVRFHIVGGGTELDNLRRQADELKLENVVFYGRRPVEEMPRIYREADAFLVTLQGNPIISLTIPGKVQSYMAVGKPVIGAIDGETKFVIEDARCGFCGKAEDARELAENIKKFIDSDQKKQMGDNARKYYEEHFDMSLFIDKLEREMEALTL